MMFSPSALAMVFVGGGLGALLRLVVGALVTERLGAAFPYGTLIINIVGSGVMGLVFFVVSQRLAGREAADAVRLFVMTGILGGFTTFSAFSLDAAILYEKGMIAAAAVYVAASVGVSIAALAAGLAAGRALFG